MPDARTVLLKAADQRGFVFYTNKRSKKGRDLAAQPKAALLFFWKSLGRQVRLQGPVEHVEEAEADAYFASRPRGSRIGAWASPQSEPLADRATLEALCRNTDARFKDQEIPRPPHWGGYRLVPQRIEFWREGADRLHDRRLYIRAGEDWTSLTLAP